MVLIVTYQRCGSSFFGELFDENIDSFYVYEPVDSYYVAKYATVEGLNTPTDISTYWNGSVRWVLGSIQKLIVCGKIVCTEIGRCHKHNNYYVVDLWTLGGASISAAHCKGSNSGTTFKVYVFINLSIDSWVSRFFIISVMRKNTLCTHLVLPLVLWLCYYTK